MDGSTDADERMYSLLETLEEDILDGVVAQDQTQFD